MSMNSMGAKIKGFFERVGKRNMVIAGAVVLIAASVLLNWAFFSAGKAAGSYPGYDQGTGSNAGESETGKAPGTADTNSAYYSSVQVSRQRARDEALEVLQTVVANDQATDAMKQEALAEIASIAKEIEKEANIETLVESKGFMACVAVISGDSASVIVSTKDNTELNRAQLAQINEIVYSQTNLRPEAITIIRK